MWAVYLYWLTLLSVHVRACANSPVLQAVVHDVPLVGRLEEGSPGQQHGGGGHGPNHQVEGLLQVHVAYGVTGVSSKVNLVRLKGMGINEKRVNHLSHYYW